MNPDPDEAKHKTQNTKYEHGADLFNRGEYFDAHEVWEELWMDCPAADRRFVQALIQAAVAIYHYQRQNDTGAARLFRSGKKYMEPYRPVYHGLDVEGFWRQMELHLAPALGDNTVGSAGPRPVIAFIQTPTGSS